MTAARKRKQAPDNVVALNSNGLPEFVDVTPELAREWLARNTTNRDVRAANVTRFANDMSHGRWTQTGEAIKFAASGALIDGQHRLHAVEQSGCTVRMLVVPGLDESAQAHMDQGVKRTPGDALKFQGYQYANTLAAVGRLGVLVERDVLFKDTGAQRVSHADILDWIERNSSIPDSAAWASTAFAQTVPLTISVRAFAYDRCHDVSSAATHDFFDRLADGHGLPKRSPLLALRSRIHQAQRRNETIPQRLLLLAAFRTWNAWREGREMTTLPIDRNGARSLPELV